LPQGGGEAKNGTLHSREYQDYGGEVGKTLGNKNESRKRKKCFLCETLRKGKGQEGRGGGLVRHWKKTGGRGRGGRLKRIVMAKKIRGCHVPKKSQGRGEKVKKKKVKRVSKKKLYQSHLEGRKKKPKNERIQR